MVAHVVFLRIFIDNITDMVICYDQIDSTNRVAKELVLKGKPSGTIVRAERQLAGKGQYGRNFISPVGGLYFSLLLQPDLQLKYLPLITLATGLACREVIFSICGLPTQIKWPNDIYLADKKVAGILCENVIFNGLEKKSPTVVIGVGLNVNNTLSNFPPGIQPIVTTLFEHLHEQLDIDTLFSSLVTSIVKNSASLGADRQAILARWQKFDYLANKAVVHTAGLVTRKGTGCGISSEGYYRIMDDHGDEHCIVGGQLRLQS